MAIRRNLNDSVATQTFIEGADKPITLEPQTSHPAPAAVTPSSMLIRFADPSIPTLLAAIAEADDRSKHHVALKAIALGLEEIRKEFNL